jgi:hypothetical protein
MRKVTSKLKFARPNAPSMRAGSELKLKTVEQIYHEP